jgi:hypothetical protein
VVALSPPFHCALAVSRRKLMRAIAEVSPALCPRWILCSARLRTMNVLSQPHGFADGGIIPSGYRKAA